MARISQVTERTDTSTGEVITIEKTYSTKVNADKFYMIFIEHMSSLFGIKSAADRKVLDSLCKLAEFNTGKVLITSGRRREICEDLEIASQTFSNSLNSLRRLGLITGKDGDYELNPLVFWKGTTDARNRLIKEQKLEITIKYGIREE